jgi:type IV pilus assembly protein PilC
MTTFRYEAVNGVGQTTKGTIEAATLEEANGKLRQQGLFPTKEPKELKGKVRGAKSASASSSRPRSIGSVKNKILTQFTRQLATLQAAGMPVLRSLRVLEDQQKRGSNIKSAIGTVANDVEAGNSLSESMARHPRVFNRLYANMVRAGEAAGVLDEILERLSQFMESSEALKRKIKGAMIYPLVVIIAATAIVTGLLIFVVPKFKEVFDGMGQELPPPTKMLLALSDSIETGGWVWILVFPLSICGGIKLLRMTEGGSFLVDKMILRIPLIGKIAAKGTISRFCSTLGTLIHAGVPILEALTITANTAGNEVFAKALRHVREQIREGENIAKPLRQTGVVDSMVVNMIDVGEETGKLDTMLDRVASVYEEEVKTLVEGLTSVIEPILIIVLGTIVAFIVVALFLPMIGMLESMG